MIPVTQGEQSACVEAFNAWVGGSCADQHACCAQLNVLGLDCLDQLATTAADDDSLAGV